VITFRNDATLVCNPDWGRNAVSFTAGMPHERGMSQPIRRLGSWLDVQLTRKRGGHTSLRHRERSEE
jgi:hypothetical protein